MRPLSLTHRLFSLVAATLVTCGVLAGITALSVDSGGDALLARAAAARQG